MPQITIPPRSEIAPEHTWNAPSVFATPEAWEAEYQRVTEGVSAVQALTGTLARSPESLADALDATFALDSDAGKLYMYAMIATSVDTNDQAAAALQGKAMALYGQVQGATAFVKPEIIALGEEQLRQWMAQELRLVIYAHYFENLFRLQAHIRSPEVEEVLGLVADPFATPYATWNMLTNAELPFPPAVTSAGEELPVAQGTLSALLSSTDRATRQTTWEHYSDAYLAFQKTLATTVAGAIKQDVFEARVRRYDSALQASLFPNNIPVAIFHNVIDTFRRHLPTWHRYWAIRRRMQGHDLHTYDIKEPLTAYDPEVSYTQAVDWISAGLRPMGDDYVDILRRGCLEERWVDIYPNQGKRGGAFSSGHPETHPFIVMSYDNSLKSMSTLAHELGHSMHSYLARHTQPLVYCDYSLFVAETASNFHQAMVRDYLFKSNPDRDFQLALIDEAMNNFHRYFFIMPTLARFELAMHERVERGASLTADVLNGMLADLFAEGYGDEVVLDRERDGITWAQFGHMFRNFYVFQYTTGIAGAHALSDGILAGESGTVDRYLEFLRTGDARYSLDALKRAGVDHATPEPLEKTFGVLAALVDRLDTLTSAG